MAPNRAVSYDDILEVFESRDRSESPMLSSSQVARADGVDASKTTVVKRLQELEEDGQLQETTVAGATVYTLAEEAMFDGAEVEQTREERERLREAKANLEEAIAELEADLADERERVSQLRERVEELEADLAEANETIAEKEDRIEELNERVGELTNSVDEKESRVEELKEELADERDRREESERRREESEEVQSKWQHVASLLAIPAILGYANTFAGGPTVITGVAGLFVIVGALYWAYSVVSAFR